MIRLDDLVGYENRKIYQDDKYFCFSVDSILLANFASLKKSTKKILDIGTGTAAIPLILTLRKENINIDAIEIQKETADLAKKSIKYNNLESKINVYNEDIFQFYTKVEEDRYDLIVCNPPYFDLNNYDKTSMQEEKICARHEVKMELESYFKVVKRVLKNGGSFAMVHRTERLLEIISLYKKYHIEPKRIRFVHTTYKKDAKMFLIEGIKDGKPGIKVLPSMVLYGEDKKTTTEYEKLLIEVIK